MIYKRQLFKIKSKQTNLHTLVQFLLLPQLGMLKVENYFTNVIGMAEYFQSKINTLIKIKLTISDIYSMLPMKRGRLLQLYRR